MSTSLEGREPFLDQHIIEWAAQLPSDFKYHNGQKKYILKQIVHQYIPKEMMERPKMGFGIPVQDWLAKELKSLVEEHLKPAALKEHGAVYLNAIGGAAQYYAKCITSVDGVDLEQFGLPEAMWHLSVKNFPAIVTMDAHGNSLHADIENISAQHLSTLAQSVY